MSIRQADSSLESLAGKLLLAHPSLQDDNFRKTVLMMSAHSQVDGAFGIILNRPTRHLFGSLQADLPFPELARIPVYHGGPVNTDRVLLGGWVWREEQKALEFYFGLSQEQAVEIMALSHSNLRAFQGYAGWSPGQLETELEQNTWVVSPVTQNDLHKYDGPALWKALIRRENPFFHLEAEAPEDPSLN